MRNCRGSHYDPLEVGSQELADIRKGLDGGAWRERVRQLFAQSRHDP
jgi:hypothetical protein